MMRHSAANGRGRGNSDSRNSPPGRRLNTLGGLTDGYPRISMRRNTDVEQEQNRFERSSMHLPEADYVEYDIEDAASEEVASEIEMLPGGFRPEPQVMYYAVARGRSVGIFTSWPEAETATVRFPRARHHRFGTREEAMQWLQDKAQLMEEKAEVESAAERQMREFNETYKARMRKVMSSEQSSVSFGTEQWVRPGVEQRQESEREGAPRGKHPTRGPM
jgi:hypothetical protein